MSVNELGLKNWLLDCRFKYLAALASIAFYNNWLMALAFNRHALRAGATISELSVRGQPKAVFFRAGDLLAGVFLVASCESLAGLASSRRQRLVLKFSMLIFGISTCLDALLPMGCSPALSRECARLERMGLVSGQHLFHIIESPLIYVVMFLLPLSVVLPYGRQKNTNPKGLRCFSWLLIIMMIAWAFDSWWRFAHQSTAYGYEQLAFTVIFSVWFIWSLRVARSSVPGSKAKNLLASSAAGRS